MHVILRVQLGDLLLRNSEIEHLEVIQALGEHTRLHATFLRDQATDVTLEGLLGAPVQVTLKGDQDENEEPITIFQGTVASGTQGHFLHHGSRFEIEGVSPSIRLDFESASYFANSTAADVARRMGAVVNGNMRLKTPLDLVQHGETDFEFLKRLADDNGLFLRTDGPQVELRDSFDEQGTVVKWGDDLVSVTARATPTNHGTKGAYYSVEEKRDHRFHGVRKDAARLPGAEGVVAAAASLATRLHGGGDPWIEENPHRVATLADYKVALQRESERVSGSNVAVMGESHQIRLRAGNTVKITATSTFKVPTLGTLGLVHVVHRFDGQQYTNNFVATTWANFTNLLRPTRRLMPGPVTADVVSIDDPKKMGRIQVRYRWQDLKQQTRWLRVLTLYSGNGRGVLFTPEVGDEVLVGFEHGDPERAYVLGALWNGKDLAPQEKGVKRIVTRSGHTIQLADEPSGKEAIEIFSPEGRCWIQLATDGGGGPLITVHSEGDLSLEAKGELRVSCQSFVLNSKADATLEVGGKMTVDAKDRAIVNSAADLVLQGGRNATLKGGMNVNSVAGAISNVVGKLVHIQPPGFVAPPVTITKPKAKKSAWSKKGVPKVAKGKSTGDAPTPRVS